MFGNLQNLRRTGRKNSVSMLHADGINDTLQTWDWRYYAEQRRKAEFDLDEAEIKPYFELSNMINASFHVAGRCLDCNLNQLNWTYITPIVNHGV